MVKLDKILAAILFTCVVVSITIGFTVTDWTKWLHYEQAIGVAVLGVLTSATFIAISYFRYLFIVSVFATAMAFSHLIHLVYKAPYNVIVGHSAIGLLSIIVGILVQKFYTNKRTNK